MSLSSSYIIAAIMKAVYLLLCCCAASMVPVNAQSGETMNLLFFSNPSIAHLNVPCCFVCMIQIVPCDNRLSNLNDSQFWMSKTVSCMGVGFVLFYMFIHVVYIIICNFYIFSFQIFLFDDCHFCYL